MTLTTQELFRLLDGKQMTIGRAAGILSRDRHRPSLPAAQRAFVQTVHDTLRERPAPPPPHPEAAARTSTTRRDATADLTPVELAWLDRLPRDPSQIRFEDAAELAALAGSINKMRTPQSARLVDAVWLPVKAIHDRRAADAQLAQARRPMPSLPPETKDAVLAALAAQKMEISSEALHAEAAKLIDDFNAARSNAHESNLRTAKERVNELTERERAYADRTGSAV